MNNFVTSNQEGAPYGYEIYNTYNGSFSPSTVHTRNTALHNYYCRYLLQRAMSVFEWKMPELWERRAKNYMLYCLYCIGFFAVISTDKYGVIPQDCTLTGYDIFYQPNRVMISNPEMKADTREFMIGSECALIRLQPDYGGIMDIIYYYADQMSLLSEAISVNAVNTKLSFAFGAKDKAQAETLKKMYDQYSDGTPAVFFDKNLLDPKTGQLNIQFFNNNVRESYVITDLLNDLRTVVNDFDSHIGIPNANTQKRERLITDEVNANNFETRSMCELWLDSLKAGCAEARELFGVDLSVDWRVDALEGGAADGSAKSGSDIQL